LQDQATSAIDAAPSFAFACLCGACSCFANMLWRRTLFPCTFCRIRAAELLPPLRAVHLSCSHSDGCAGPALYTTRSACAAQLSTPLVTFTSLVSLFVVLVMMPAIVWLHIGGLHQSM
jgi:hypothetical protein